VLEGDDVEMQLALSFDLAIQGSSHSSLRSPSQVLRNYLPKLTYSRDVCREVIT
jgi:hypothetical protein